MSKDNFCQCGCGKEAGYYLWNDNSRGAKKGEPRKFIRGHSNKVRYGTLLERFLNSFKMTDIDKCWEWEGALDNYGYGAITRDGNQYRAHRLSYEFYKGPVVDRLFVCHTCDNRKCVNPHHLFLGTHRDNMKDAKNKCRMRNGNQKGYRNGNAKLCDSLVLGIRELRKNFNLPYLTIAKKFGVSKETIYFICAGKTWKHVE